MTDLMMCNIFYISLRNSRVAFPDIKSKQARLKIKQKYKINPQKINYYFPPKWNINKKLGIKE